MNTTTPIVTFDDITDALGLRESDVYAAAERCPWVYDLGGSAASVGTDHVLTVHFEDADNRFGLQVYTRSGCLVSTTFFPADRLGATMLVGAARSVAEGLRG